MSDVTAANLFGVMKRYTHTHTHSHTPGVVILQFEVNKIADVMYGYFLY